MSRLHVAVPLFPSFLASAALAAPLGWHDSANTFGVAGWACDSTNYNAALNIDVYDQFGYVGSTTANAFRPDVGQAGICAGTSFHGFNFSFSQSTRNLRDNQTHTFSTYATSVTGGNVLLSGSPKSVFMSADSPAYGWVDAADGTLVTGWTCDPDNVNSALTVSVYDDAGLIGQTVANLPRGDLGGVCGGNLAHAYNFFWTQSQRNVRDGQNHNIRVYAQDSETGQQIQLSGSPRTTFIPPPPNTTVAIAPPSCGIAFSTGEQYRDPPGQGRGHNGLLYNQWFMLARWQGANESNFVSNPVAYDVGNYTGLHGASQQRGVFPERADGSAAVQNSCTTSGMLLNSWTSPHRPVVGGWANDMLGYAFSADVRPFVAGGLPTYMVWKAKIAVPLFVYAKNSARAPNSPPVGQVGLFAYLKDKRHAAAPPIVVLAMSHGSDLPPDWPGFRARDYEANWNSPFNNETQSTNYAKSNYQYWFTDTAFNGDGVCFFSMAIKPSNYLTLMPDNAGTFHGSLPQTFALVNGQIVGNAAIPLESYSVALTPANMSNIVAVLNDPAQTYCPFKPSDNYSTDPADWALEYAGVIAEAPVPSDQRLSATDPGNYDPDRLNWGGRPNGPAFYGDVSKDQVVLGVRIDSPGIFRHFP
jgi:hypothetical protein